MGSPHRPAKMARQYGSVDGEWICNSRACVSAPISPSRGAGLFERRGGNENAEAQGQIVADGIATWLEEIGLGAHVEAFVENGIDRDILSELSDSDLADLGLNLGDRRRLQRALRDSLSETDATVDTQSDAERRQISVLFCDLVGSTELSRTLDPEDMRELLAAYQQACTAVIARYDGYVAKFMGDGIYAYFGYPLAHEDDAERATNAGLTIVQAVAALEQDLSVRIGIATGTVAVGDIIGSGSSEEAAIVGEAPNLAARLQALSAPNKVTIGSATFRLAGALFETEALGRHDLKGFDEPVPAWNVRRPRRTESRFHAMHRRELSTLVGREDELDILRRRWEEVKGGTGHTVVVSGEPGIGKSRLIHAFREQLAGETSFIRTLQCSPHHSNTAMFPFLERASLDIGIDPADTDATKVAKLVAWIEAGNQSAHEIAPILGPMLGIDCSAEFPVLDVTPQRHKELMWRAFADRVSNIAAQTPLLMIFEDAHWIDPTSLENIGLYVERARDIAAMFVVTCRPEFSAPWTGQAHTTLLSLNRLGRDQCAALVRDVGGVDSLSPDVVEQIADRTDGVPLFVEELTKAVVEARHDDPSASAIEVPETLQDSLEARLDRLGPAREIAQVGAVIGRSFDYRLIAEVTDIDDVDLRNRLERLQASGLIFWSGTTPDASYAFKHALIQDTAYASLLRRARVGHHKRIADVLQSSFPDIASARPELLAHHFTEAEMAEPAIEQWTLAGTEAAQRGSNVECIEYLERALSLLETLPATGTRDATELEILTQLGPAVMVVKGWAAPEVGKVYDRAHGLAGAMERSAHLVPPLVGAWLYQNARGHYDQADRLTSELFDIADATSDIELKLQAHHSAWPIPMFRGRFETSGHHIEQGLELYEYDRHKHHCYLYMGHDPAVCAHACGAQAIWALGETEKARQHADVALDLARRLNHAPTLAFALWYVSGANAARDDVDAVQVAADELLALSQEQKLAQTEASARFLGGWAIARNGDVRDGLRTMQLGFQGWERIGARAWLQLFSGLYVDALIQGKRYGDALEAADTALAYSDGIGERWWESRVYHLRGEALLHKGETELADQSFRAAVETAGQQGAPSWELRAALRHAEILGNRGDRATARDLLAPVIGKFGDGGEAHDFKSAQKLLSALT